MDKELRHKHYKYSMGLDAWSMSTLKDPSLVISVSDGPCGVRQVGNNKTIPASCIMSPSSIAASFSKEVAYKNGAIAAKNCLDRNIDILLAPGVNLKRDILNGRNFEYFSEDPLLSGALAASYINGVQDNGVAACIKHFCCNNKEFARKVNSSELSLRALNELYIGSFRYALHYSNPLSIMTSYNKVNGEYVVESDYLLNKKLKGELGFKGLIMSDWHAVSNKAKTLKTGLHVQMPEEDIDIDYLDKACDDGVFSDEDLIRNDNEAYEAMKKIADLRKDTPYKHDYDKAHFELEDLAKYACVLVKNEDNYLPVKEEDKVLIVGYLGLFAKNVGDGSAYAKGYYEPSIIEILQRRECNFAYARGHDERERVCISEDELIFYKSQGYNKVIVILGQYLKDEGECFERHYFKLHREQQEMLGVVKKVYDKFASVIITGSVMGIEDIYNSSSSVLINYVSGEGQAAGIVDCLYGLHNPSGRLPETWIGELNQNPIYDQLIKHQTYYEYYDEDIYLGYRYYFDNRDGFVLPFGYGLSYGQQVEYKDYKAIVDGDNIICKVKAINHNGFDTTAVPQIYVGKKNSRVYRAKYEFKGFESVLLKPYEEKEIIITIPTKFLSVYDIYSDSMKVEDGAYELSLATNSFTMLDTVEINVKGEQLKENLKVQPLPRKAGPSDFNVDTPTGVLMCMGEKPFFDFFSKIPGLDIKTLYAQMHWNGGDPIRSLVSGQYLTYRQLLDLIDYYNKLDHEFIKDIDCI